jgi:hypothetical protein
MSISGAIDAAAYGSLRTFLGAFHTVMPVFLLVCYSPQQPAPLFDIINLNLLSYGKSDFTALDAFLEAPGRF